MNERLSSHLLQRVEGVSIIERGWSCCLIEITFQSSTFVAHLTKWRCWWAGDSLFVTNPSPRPRLVCMRASEEGGCIRKGTSTVRTSILGAPKYGLWNVGPWNLFLMVHQQISNLGSSVTVELPLYHTWVPLELAHFALTPFDGGAPVVYSRFQSGSKIKKVILRWKTSGNLNS